MSIIYMFFKNLFEVIIIECLPLKARRKFYTRVWGRDLEEDYWYIEYFCSYNSGIKRRLRTMSDTEISNFITEYKFLNQEVPTLEGHNG